MIKQSSPISPIYFLYGPEDYLIEEEIERLLNKTLTQKERGLNLHLFNGEEHRSREIVQTAQTLPMFSRYRYVLVRGMDQFDEESMEGFPGYFKDPSPTTCLVMSGPTLGLWKKHQKELEKTCKFIEYPRLKGKSLVSWVKKRMEERGKVLTEEAAEYLVEVIGDHLNDLDNGLEKVWLSTGDRKRIELSDVEEITSEVRVSTVFDLTDAIGQQNLERALGILEKALESKAIPFRKEEEVPKRRDEAISLLLLNMMAKHYWNIWRLKKMTSSQKDFGEVARMIRMPPWSIKKLMEQGRNFSESDLRRGILKCHQTDLAIKSNRGPKNLLMEKLVIDLCRPVHP